MTKKKLLTFIFIKVAVVGLVVASVFILMPEAKAAPIETFRFDSPEKEQSFHKLSEELRCLVCQNQNIAESNADLAKDLRLEIYQMLQQGKTEDEIVDFMVERYGDYVLYRPPFKPLTWLLWFGPLLVFAIGVYVALSYIRRQSRKQRPEALSPEEIERIKSLHAQQNNQGIQGEDKK